METIHESKNKFYMGVNEEEPIAMLNFYLEDDKEFIIEHVYVTRELREQGLALKLVDKAVAYAREKRLRITSLCSYAEKVLRENEAYGDVFSDRNE